MTMSDSPLNNPNGSSGAQIWPSAGVGARRTTTARHEPAPKRVAATAGFLVDAARRRRGPRIAMWFMVITMALVGIGLVSYPFVTDLWANRIQDGLEQQFADDSPARLQVYKTRGFQTGDAVTRIRIPKLGVDKVVVEGVSGNALRAGVGHYPVSALPGEPTGNVAIAGHRTGFGEPFRHLHTMTKGDEIWLETPIGRYRYQVIGAFDGHKNPWITSADDWSVISTTAEPVLTLTTCDPPGTSLNRLILRAKLVQTLPPA